MQLSYKDKIHNKVEYFPLPNGYADVFLHRNEKTETTEDGSIQYVAEEVYFQIDESVTKEQIENNFDYMWHDAKPTYTPTIQVQTMGGNMRTMLSGASVSTLWDYISAYLSRSIATTKGKVQINSVEGSIVSEAYYDGTLHGINGIADSVNITAGKTAKAVGYKENVGSGTAISYEDMADDGRFIAYYVDGTQQIGVKGDMLTVDATKLTYQLANPIVTKIEPQILTAKAGDTIMWIPDGNPEDTTIPDIEIEYRVDLGGTVDMLTDTVQLLDDRIDMHEDEVNVSAHKAKNIALEDVDEKFTSTNVEEGMKELSDSIDTANTIITAHENNYIKHPAVGITEGSSTAYTFNPNPPLIELVSGVGAIVTAHVASGTNPTLNISGKGAKPILKPNGSPAKIVKNGVYHVRYNGTNFMLLGEGGEGNAQPEHVLAGKTFTNDDDVKTGTMPNQGQKIITPGISNQTIVSGYHNGSGYVEGDANLIAANIVKDKSIFGVLGSYDGKRWASGATMSKSTGTQVTLDDGSTDYYYALEVTGLDFTPSFVYAYRTPGTLEFAIYDVNNDLTTNGTRNVLVLGVGTVPIRAGFAVTPGRFFMLVMFGNYSYNWLAIE